METHRLHQLASETRASVIRMRETNSEISRDAMLNPGQLPEPEAGGQFGGFLSCVSTASGMLFAPVLAIAAIFGLTSYSMNRE